MATIFLGLGGSGIGVVSKIKENYKKFEFTRTDVDLGRVIFAGIDIDKPSQKESENIIFIPVAVNSPKAVIDKHFSSDSVFRKWWKRGYYPANSLTPSQGAGQYRFHGRLLFWYNFQYIRNELERLIARANTLSPDHPGIGFSHKIYVINSIGGGTGAGLFIEIGFMLRDLLEQYQNIGLFSFIFHGNIWQSAGIPNSNMVALGALTELERWMEKPETYQMKFITSKLPMNVARFNKLFDLVILIDQENLDGKRFIKSGNQSLIELYMNYGAWVLFMLSLEDIDQYYQNVTSNLGQLEPFKDLQERTDNSRSRRFASYGLTVLTVPYSEITDYILGAYVSRFKNGFKGCALGDQEISNLIKVELRIYEEDGNQLSAKLKGLDEFEKDLKVKLESILSDLRSTKNLDIWFQNYETHKLEDLSELTEIFDRWGLSIDEELGDIREEFSKKIRAIIENEIENTFDFTGLLDFLKNIDTKLELQNEKVKKEYYQPQENYSSKVIENLQQIANDIRELPTNPLMFALKKGKFNNLIEEWITFSGIDLNSQGINNFISSKICEVLYNRLKNFYSSLQYTLGKNMNVVRSLKKIYSKVINFYEEQEIAYKFDKENIIDMQKFMKQEFPLEIIVPIHREDLRETINTINNEDGDIIRDLHLELWAGLNTDTRELKGMKEFVRLMYDDFYEADGRNKDSIIARGTEYTRAIVKVNLNRSFREMINDDYRIDKSLKRYFERKYNEYQNVLNLPETKSTFITRFRYQVGQDTIGELQKTKIERTEWVQIAMRGFLRKLATMNNPFWSIKNIEAFNIISVPRLEQKNPENGPVVYRNPDLDLPFDDGNTLADMSADSFRIVFLTFSHGCPLYLMNCVRNANDKLYHDLNQSLPAFSDMRFMDEWKDNIEHATRFEGKDFSFIMGLAFDIIKRKPNGYFYGKKKLGSITDVMHAIKGDTENKIKFEIRNKLTEEIFKPRATASEIIENYEALILKVDNILSKIEPPKTRGGMTAHNIWQHLKDKVDKAISDEGVKKGDFYKNSLEDLKSLIGEHIKMF